MKKRMYKIVSLLLAAVVMSTSVNVDVLAKTQNATESVYGDKLADEIEEIDLEESNDVDDIDELIEIEDGNIENTDLVDEEIIDANDYSLGYIQLESERNVESVYDYPDDFDYSDQIEEVYPSEYKSEYLPPLRDQNPYGTCWAHSSLALAEINMKKKGLRVNPDYSELHLSYFTYKNTAIDPLGGTEGDVNSAVYDAQNPNFAERGGNYDFAAHSLGLWKGATKESYDESLRYSKVASAISSGLDQSLAYGNADAHLTNVREVPASDIASVKRLVTEYGAAGVDYFSVGTGKKVSFGSLSVAHTAVYSSTNNAYYFYADIPEGYSKTNHAVTVVGWDDNFAANKFATTAPKNGAWLIRNSWTTEDGSESYYGYFWMSYYDKTLTSGAAYAFEFEEADKYDNNYVYDGGLQTGWHIKNDKAAVANVFTAKGSINGERLSAVTFYTISTNLNYTISIYKKVKSSGSYVTNPTNGVLVTNATMTGMTKEAGVYTVELDNPVDLDYGENYTVAIEFVKSGQEIDIPYESNVSAWYITTAVSKMGQSFYKWGSSSTWTDKGTNGNYRIRALTKNLGQEAAVDVLVTYDANGGTCSPTSGLQTTGSKYVNLPIPTRSGYDFAGWFTEKDGGQFVDEDTKVRNASNHTLYAKWLPKEITVTIDVHLGRENIDSTRKLRPGDCYGSLPTYRSDGCTFKGWFTEIAYGEEITSDTVVTKTVDHTIYGHWKNNTAITMSFDANGGTCSKSSMPVYAYTPFGDYEMPTPTREGYIFNGWTLWDDSFITNDMLVPNYTSSFTIYANWSINPIDLTVTFDGNEGTPSSSSKQVTRGSEYGTLPTATREGYDFAGWYTAASGGTKVLSTTIVNSTSKHTLYAHWTAKNYIVTYDVNGGNTLAYMTKTVTYDSSYGSLSIPSRTGYDFAGWYTAATGGSKIDATTIVKTASDHTIYAHWTGKTYKVYFTVNGGDSVTPSSKDVTYGSTYGTLPTPTRTNYIFAGWYTSSSGGDKIDEDTEVSKTGTQYLYAHWLGKELTVTLDANGGSVTPGYVTVNYYGKYGELPIPTRANYVFVGWYTSATSGSKRESTTTVTTSSNHTLYAHWIGVDVTVNFDANGGSVSPGSQVVKYDAMYGELPIPTRTNYTFDGWYTSVTGGNKVTSSTKVTSASTHTLYAHWLGKELTVTLDANGGIINTNSKKVYYDGVYGDFLTPSRTGYTFKGWYTEPSGGIEVLSTTTVTNATNHTVYAHWTANQYTVSFDVNGGTSDTPADITVTYDGTYGSLPVDPIRAGYTFTGWYTSFSGGSKVVSTTLVNTASDHTLYARWTASKYIVSFDTNCDGEVASPADREVTYGQSYGKLPSILRTGYTLKGWYTDPISGVKIEDYEGVGKTSNHTLYARWTPNVYQVKFNGNNGIVQGNASQSATYDSAYGDLPTATREGYDFAGWYTSSVDGEKITKDSIVKITGLQYLYAHWTPATYTLTFNANGGDIDGKTTVTMDVTYNSTYGKLPVPTRAGYGFVGWFTNPTTGGIKVSEGGKVYVTDNSTVLYARWEYGKYTVTFDAQGGISSEGSRSVTYNTAYGELPETTREGYDFIGWYKEKTFVTKVDATSIVDEADNHTLYAKWSVKSFTVSFDTDGGSLSPSSKSVIYDSTYGELPVPTKSGYEFDGWYKEDVCTTKIDAETTVTTAANHTLYAKWTAKSYTVSYDANGGSVTPSFKSVTYDSKYGELPVPTKAGYNFVGWYEENTFETKVVASSKVTKAANHTLYAKWTEAAYTVTLDANGGTVNGYRTTSVTVKYNSAYGTLPVPTRTGYGFAGWYTAAVDGTKINAEDVYSQTDNQTLYAHWEYGKYTVSFEAQGGSVDPVSMMVTYDSVYGELPIPDRTGYTFNGWYTSTAFTTQITDSTTVEIANDHTLYAKWTPISYTVTFENCGGECGVSSKEVTYDSEYGELPVPIRYGYIFEGWYTEETEGSIVFSDTIVNIASNHVLYARWIEKDKLQAPVASVESGEIKAGTKILLSTKSLGANIYYTIDPEIGAFVSSENGEIYVEPIEITSDTTIWAVTVRDGYLNSEIMTVSYTIKDESDDWGDIEEEDRTQFATANDVPSDLWAAGVPESVDYTGKAIVFNDLHVYNGKKSLAVGVDYTVKYTKNTNAGIASVKITGKGNYGGSTTETFVILPATDEYCVKAADISLPYNKKVQKGTTTVLYKYNNEADGSYNYVTLKKGKDYDLYYDLDNYNYKDPGEYVVSIVGKGNYKGLESSFNEKIYDVDEELKSIAKCKFGKVATQMATGESCEPDISIKDGTYELVKDSDYSVEYFNNIYPGTGTAIVTGIGNYTGTKILTFKISTIVISKALIGSIDAVDYTGEAWEPDVDIQYRANKNDEYMPLSKDVDYKVTYQNNVNAGKNKAIAVITGIGRFGGTVKKKFTINQANIEDYNYYGHIGEFDFVKGGVKPTVGGLDKDVQVWCGDNELMPGTDYTVTYKNNKNIADTSSAKVPTLTIKGKGNYCGTVTKTFDIGGSSIAKANIVVGDIVYSNKAGTCKPMFTVYDVDGTKLVAGKDYEKSYSLEYVEDTKIVEVIDKKKKVSEEREVTAGTIVDTANQIIPSGTYIRLIITGKGNYVGDESEPSTISAVFRYVDYDISKATVTIVPQYYIGETIIKEPGKDDVVESIKIEPGKNDIVVKIKINKKQYILSDDEYSIEKYLNNGKKGTGKVVLRGKQGTESEGIIFGGTKTVSFKILSKPIDMFFNSFIK